MSNNQPPTKSASKKKTAPKSKTSSTASKKEEPDDRTMSILDRMEKLLDKKEAALAPLEEFHAAVESAEDEDVRVYWDVRIVSGKDIPLKGVQGSSTMPGLLTEKMIPQAPSMIQQEIVDKIALPLTGVFMTEGEVRNPLLPAPEAADDEVPEGFADYAGEEKKFATSGDKLASIIDAKGGRNVQEAEILTEADEEDRDPDDEAREPESSERKEEERDDA